VIRGYGFTSGFNKKINTFIRILFDLRAKYKREGNPLEKTIKLLLNSIYGKSIMKDVMTQTVVRTKDELWNYVIQNYHRIEQINQSSDSNRVFLKVRYPVVTNYTLPQFGISVLSWSKHIMNRVMCLAEQNGIQIFYQDTDSMHLFEKDLDRLSRLFQAKYRQKLIGEKLCQFHSDFTFSGGVGEIYSRKLIVLGKKAYLDCLVDSNGAEAYHIRMKGVTDKAIAAVCHSGLSIEDIYMDMAYNGTCYAFDLTQGRPCFKKTKTYRQVTLPSFIRRVKFLGDPEEVIE
jgi:hypothetical protein